MNGNGSSFPCGGACGFHYHTACVDGMTPEFAENCETMAKIHGISPFFCLICRRFIEFSNTTFKQQGDEIKVVRDENKEIKAYFKDELKAIRADLKAVDAEKRVLQEKVKAMEAENRLMAAQITDLLAKTDQVKTKVVTMEVGMESNMEKALKDVQLEMAKENEEKDRKALNIVIHGAAESGKTDKEEVKADEEEMVMKLAEAMEVEIEGDIQVMYRTGAKKADGKPRPLVVKVSNDATREKLLTSGNRLARKTDWKKVFVSLDLTYQQREEARKLDAQLYEEAEKKTEEAKNEGRGGGRYRVVGQRGRRKEEGGRRIEWRDDRV